MVSTYENLKPLTALYTGTKDFTQAALQYQETQDPAAFAYIFCGYFAFIKSVTDQFYYVTESDKASFALEELHKSLLAFDLSRGFKVQTLFSTYLRKRLVSETGVKHYQKRKANNSADSYERLLEDCVEEGQSLNELDDINFMMSLTDSNLTDVEVRFCKIVLQEKVNCADIAKRLNISGSMVSYIKKSLRTKLVDFCMA